MSLLHTCSAMLTITDQTNLKHLLRSSKNPHQNMGIELVATGDREMRASNLHRKAAESTTCLSSLTGSHGLLYQLGGLEKDEQFARLILLPHTTQGLTATKKHRQSGYV
jgi:hypothetical protein